MEIIILKLLSLIRTNNKLKKYERLCRENDYYRVKMPEEDSKIP